MASGTQFFESLTSVDNVTKNVVKEVMRECYARKVQINEELVIYYVKLACLDPTRGFAPERSIDREMVAKFIEDSVTRLSDAQSSLMICLRMQLYYYLNCMGRDAIVSRERNKFAEKLKRLETEVLFADVKHGGDEECTFIYKRIVIYIIMRSGMGNPLNETVQLETFVALQSIYPVSEVKGFAKWMSTQEKRQVLEELACLVGGIRLFNRDIGKGGEGIEDVPALLQESIHNIYDQIGEKLESVMLDIRILTDVLSRVYDQIVEPVDGIVMQEPEYISKRVIRHCKGLLKSKRQYEIYLRRLLSEIEVVQSSVDNLTESFKTSLQKLHQIVKFRTAIPTAQVFPSFLDLEYIWSNLLNEAIILHQIKDVYNELVRYVTNLRWNQNSLVQKLNEDLSQRSIVAPFKEEELQVIPKVANDCEIVLPDQIEHYHKLPIQFSGFCPVRLLKTKGALFPGDPSIGLVVWNNMYFSISNVANGIFFQQNTDEIINKCLELARRHLDLVFLLQIYEHLRAVRDIGELYVKTPKVIVHCEADVQTELHPVPTNIDKKYMWNVWDLKRQAILYTNLIKRRTHSFSTYYSNYRVPVEVQTYSPRNKATTTMKDKGTNVPTLQNFIFGLRGRKDDVQHIIQLTRPVNE